MADIGCKGVDFVEKDLLSQQIEDSKKAYDAQDYQKLVDKIKPKPEVLRNALAAFFVGGLICMLGQGIGMGFESAGLSEKEASAATVATLIFIGALLTGIGVYDDIGRFAGAGSIIPITGFSNSIVSAAMEYKSEGYVFGVGARMFTIAGPVLVYGFVTSTVIGLIYYLIR